MNEKELGESKLAVIGYVYYNMKQHEVIAPHSAENDKFEKCKTLTDKNFSFEEIKKSEEEKIRFLSSRPFPLYQGPFPRPIGMKVLNQSFVDFTTFKHSSKLCSDLAGKKILGPASKPNGSILYNCQYANKVWRPFMKHLF